MSSRNEKRRLIVASSLIVFLVLGWLIGLGGWPFIQWSPLNRSHEEIDINSGRVRKTRELAGITIQQSIEDTAVSRKIASENAGREPAWRMVNTFSPMVRYSPHYLYHAAIFQLGELEMSWNFYHFSENAKRQTARDLLGIWQRGNGDYPATDYMSQLETMAEKHRDGPPVEVKDLPDVDSIKP